MVKLVDDDIKAALVLCWLKYVPVTKQDDEKMNKTPVLPKKEPEIMEKSKRKLLRINNNENPEVQNSKRVKDSSSGFGSSSLISKRVKNSSSGLMNLTKNSYGSSSFSKKTETHEASSSKRVRVLPSTLMNLPKLPPTENLTTLIGQCSNPFVKQLTKSDVDEHQGRLLLNNEDVRKQLLPLLNEEYEDLVSGIKVETFDSMGKLFNMTFKTWGNYKTYVLLGNWIQFIKEHELKINDYVIVWMFRHKQTGELCFALTWRKKE